MRGWTKTKIAGFYGLGIQENYFQHLLLVFIFISTWDFKNATEIKIPKWLFEGRAGLNKTFLTDSHYAFY